MNFYPLLIEKGTLPTCTNAYFANPFMLLLELVDIYKHYRMGQTLVPVLRGINLRIHAGEMLAIGGPSGSGNVG